MKPFISENFLLTSDAAVTLYHEYAKVMPILDYHCHLSPQEVSEDRRFSNLAEAWLEGDHYKWRAMRAAGVDEQFVTGDGDDDEKFRQWASVVPQCLRNPLYHWTHLELNRPLGINDRLLSPETAASIYAEANEKLALPEFSARGIMRKMEVRLVCTTDDPVDSLEHHAAIAADASFEIKVLPTMRPDKAMAIADPVAYNAWVGKLEQAAGVTIGKSYEDFLAALAKRYDYFHAQGCRLSDHGFTQFPNTPCSESEAASIFHEVRGGATPTPEQCEQFATALMHELAVLNHTKGWTQQLHLGAIRNNNSKQFAKLGPDAGYDSIADGFLAESLSRFFDSLANKDCLARTIVYNLNPIHNDLIATMLGNFQDGETPGKMQFGSGWWFLDQRLGMIDQLNTLSNHGLLSQFVGMLTDSRSFLSYTRHEYFRRILCELLGSEMEAGLLPRDFALIGKLVQDVSYNNAAGYFGFEGV